MTFQLELSLDGGTTWNLLAKATATGGAVATLGGIASSLSGVAAKLSQPLTGAQVRGSLIVANGTIHTSGTLTLQ